jgi:hypothetical protein
MDGNDTQWASMLVNDIHKLRVLPIRHVRFVQFSQLTAIISLRSSNRLMVVLETSSIFFVK